MHSPLLTADQIKATTGNGIRLEIERESCVSLFLWAAAEIDAEKNITRFLQLFFQVKNAQILYWDSESSGRETEEDSK